MSIKSMQDLFIHELSDIYSAEKQLAKALPRLSRAADNQELSKAFDKHLEETRGQIERIDQVVDQLDLRLKRMKCQGMEGLVDEAREIIETIPQGALRDAALIAGAQKAEHYEIASYGTLCALAKQLGHQDAAKLLSQTLEEEKATDKRLTELAEQGANQEAAQASRGGERHAAASEARH
ncbi:ferritin-like domain-containing protein [Fulvimonas yonginensis]|uniref:Ferritin-like domain-containing protein n=1 Tax=Fulvimonas yonginensis TaxID=1495200 RepID=A0ABU8J7M3_9GAMM